MWKDGSAMDLNELIAIAKGERAARKPIQVRVCSAAGCLSSNALAVRQGLDATVARVGLGDRVQVCEVGCMRLCSEGPLVWVEPEGSLYQQVAPDQAASIIGTLGGGTTEARRGDPNSPFFARQRPIVLENSGVVEPERIESYLAAGGYPALYRALRALSWPGARTSSTPRSSTPRNTPRMWTSPSSRARSPTRITWR
jgi:bidirectional [NiFe] hydrogenase diaphorase subunit